MLRDKERNEKDAKAQAELPPPGRNADAKLKVLNTEIPTGFRASFGGGCRVLGKRLADRWDDASDGLGGPGRRIRHRESRSGGGTSRLR
jgi:hypothetical protein